MIDFHSIYQQEINVLANSMKGRQMRKICKNKQVNSFYSPDILLLIRGAGIFPIWSIPLFMRDC